MEFYELIPLSFALSMDAFAVSVSEGMRMKSRRSRHAWKVALCFGFFQALMPALGYLAGVTVDRYIESVDHWVALCLLGFIGARMIRDACRKREREHPAASVSDNRTLVVLGLATSIDALAAGISLAIENARILPCSAVIGAVTGAVCYIGAMLGQKLGRMFQKRAEILGGVVLILLGVNILLEHLLA